MRGAKFQIKRFLDWSRKRWTEGAVLATEEIAPKLSSFPHYGRHCRSCVRDRGVTSALPFLLTWFPSKRAEHGHCVKNMSGVEVGVTVMAGPGGVGVSPGETGVAQRRLREAGQPMSAMHNGHTGSKVHLLTSLTCSVAKPGTFQMICREGLLLCSPSITKKYVVLSYRTSL